MPDGDEEEAFSLDVKIQRGNGTDDRDTLKAKVSADTLEELDEKVEHVQERMSEWAVGFREIQPSEERRLDDDQSSLTEVKRP